MQFNHLKAKTRIFDISNEWVSPTHIKFNKKLISRNSLKFKTNNFSNSICFFLFFVFFFHFLNNSFGSSNNNICTKHLNQFIESHKQFEQCALKHAVPVTMCEKCVEPYVSIVQIFHDLTTTPDPNNVRHKCIDQFIDHNALNIFWNQYQSSRNLWNEAACTSNSFV